MIMIFGTLLQNDDISRTFFQFFKILIFGVVRRVKVQKMVQNDKKFCLSRIISQEPYIIWLSFMVHMHKMIISPSLCFIFSKFWFSGSIGELKGKKWSRMTENVVCRAPYLRNHTSCDCHLWCKFVKW